MGQKPLNWANTLPKTFVDQKHLWAKSNSKPIILLGHHVGQEPLQIRLAYLKKETIWIKEMTP